MIRLTIKQDNVSVLALSMMQTMVDKIQLHVDSTGALEVPTGASMPPCCILPPYTITLESIQ